MVRRFFSSDLAMISLTLSWMPSLYLYNPRSHRDQWMFHPLILIFNFRVEYHWKSWMLQHKFTKKKSMIFKYQQNLLGLINTDGLLISEMKTLQLLRWSGDFCQEKISARNRKERIDVITGMRLVKTFALLIQATSPLLHNTRRKRKKQGLQAGRGKSRSHHSMKRYGSV